jgi:uncharacterized RDD family membrane protein YckC
MKNDKQFIWGVIIIMIIIPYANILFDLVFSYFNDTFEQSLANYTATFSNAINAFTVLFQLVFKPVLIVIGIKKYQREGKKEILFFFLLMTFITSGLFIINYVISNKDVFSNPSRYLIYVIFELITLIISILLAFLACRYLSERIKIKTDSFQDIHQAIAQKPIERFYNYLIDILMAAFLFGSMSSYLYKRITNGQNNDFYLLISAMLCLFTYYLLTEGLFKVTFGKIITNSTVIDDKGEIVSFDKVIGRTLCRMIPFEQFSFLLTNRGLHDSFTDTYVIKTE